MTKVLYPNGCLPPLPPTDSASTGGPAQPEPDDSPNVPAPSADEDGSEAEFLGLQEDAFVAGREFATTEGDYTAKLENLLPKLSRVRSEIGQRREHYKKGRRGGIPNWGKWLGIFRANTGVRLSNKTFKRHLDKYDGIKPAPRPMKRKSPMIAASTVKKLVLAGLLAHQLVDAIKDSKTAEEIDDAAQCFSRAALSPAELEQLLSEVAENEQDKDPNDPVESNSETLSGWDQSAGNPPKGESLMQLPLEPGGVPGLANTRELVPSNLAPTISVRNIHQSQGVAPSLSGYEEFNCLHLTEQPDSDGRIGVIVDEVHLGQVMTSRKQRKYFLAGVNDPFNPCVGFETTDKIIASILKKQESQFRVETPYLDRARDYAKLAASHDFVWQWPVNLELGISVRYPTDLALLVSLAEIHLEYKWVSFAEYHCDPSRPLVSGDLTPMLHKCALREIVVDTARNLSVRDADCLDEIAKSMGMGCDIVDVRHGTPPWNGE